MADDQAVLNEIMNKLEVEPSSCTYGAGTFALSDDAPTRCEQLAILVSTGKSKDAIGIQLTHDQVKRLSDKDVEKYQKRYESYLGTKTTEGLIDSFLMLFSKGVGMVVPIDDIKELQKELKQDYIINRDLSTFSGDLALRFGRLLAVANAALMTTKHIVITDKKPDEVQEQVPSQETDKAQE